jgi:uncharacterized protein (TIGR03086 family)
MTAGSTASALTGGVALLERAMAYTLGSLRLVTPEAMENPTPCAGWNLRMLLLHMNDSLRALQEAIAEGNVDLDPGVDDGGPAGEHGNPAADPVTALRNRACEMVGAWANAGEPGEIAVADRTLTPSVVAATGAVEVAVHGWDVARACGYSRPIPPALAEELLELSPLFVRAVDRATRFADSIELGPMAEPSDRLVAFLGRQPC